MEDGHGEGEIFSPYEAQLHALFRSCDTLGKGTLDREALSLLCNKLGLEHDQSQGLLKALLSGNNNVMNHIQVCITYSDFKEGFVRFWKELAFIEGATRLAASPIESTTVIEMEEEEIQLNSGCEDQFQTVYLSESVVDKPVRLNEDFEKSVRLNDDFAIDKASALMYVRKIWEEISEGREVATRSQLASICDVIQPKMLTEEMVGQLFTSLDEDCDGQVQLEDFLELFLGSSDIFGPTSNQPKTRSKLFNEELCLSPSLDTESLLSSIQDENLLNGAFPRKMSDCQTEHITGIGNLTNRLTSAEEILKYWNTIGIENGEMVLQDLGLYMEDESDAENIDVNELTRVLQVELEQCIDSIGLPLRSDAAFMCKAKGKAAALSCKAEMQSLRGTLESVERERQKLMKDLVATNQRVTVFAQDVDEQNARMEEANKEKIRELERHYLNQIKTLRGELSQEKEEHASLNQEIDHKKRYYSLQLSEQENRLKEDICQMQIENQHLEEENEELKFRLGDSERLNAQLKMELSKVVNYSGFYGDGILVNNNNNNKKSKVIKTATTTTTTTVGTSTDELIKSNLEEEVEKLSQRVVQLNDQNRQLQSRLEAQVNSFEFEGERDKGFQFEGERALDKEINETLIENGLPNDFPHLTNGNHIDDESSNQKMEADSSALALQIENISAEMSELQTRLISALEQLSVCKNQQAVDEERISALSNKCVQLQTRLWNSFNPPSSSSCASTHSLPNSDETRLPAQGVSDQPFSLPVSMENSPGPSKKPMELERHCQNLEDELDIVKKEILKILSEKTKCSKENAELKKALATDVSLTFNGNETTNLPTPTFLPTLTNLPTPTNNLLTPSNTMKSKKMQDRYSPDGQEDLSKISANLFSKNEIPKSVPPVEEKSKDEIARKELEAKCKELEESLELMQAEFEKMEDYWQSKLDEERNFYEEQLRTSDLRFKELELKMKEYEEMLMNSEDVGKSFDDKLSTIEESASLECQVAELENEIETLRNELRDKELRMQTELKQVQSFWQTKLYQVEASHNLETNALKEALKILRRQTNPLTLSWSSSSTSSNVRNKFRSEEEEVGHDGDFNGDGCNPVSAGLMVIKPVCDAWTQVPGVSGNPSEALSSVALAYQAVLHDIDREKECLRIELERMLRNHKNPPDTGLLSTVEIIQSRLKQQEERCHHLQSALKQQQKHSRRILEDMREQHESEIRNLENLMKASQDMLQQQVTKYSEQMQRLGHSESLVRQLLTENETLVTAIRNLQYNVEL